MTNTKKLETEGRVIWITGLSGSGKTALALEVIRKLKEIRKDVLLLDGDELRNIFSLDVENSQNYDRATRITLSLKYAKLAKLLSLQGGIVIVSTISMFKEVYAWNKENLPGYFEVYLKVPLEELFSRDSKKIYSRYENMELKNVAGLDLQVDEPTNSHWSPLFQKSRSVTCLADELLTYLED